MVVPETLDNIVIAISRGIHSAYFGAVMYDKLPSKEVIHEAKSDIEYALGILNGEANTEIQKTARRLRVYLDIVQLLEEVPEEFWLREKEFTQAVSFFAYQYAQHYSEIKDGNVAKMLPDKYRMLEEKSRISTIAVVEGSDSHISKMLQVADKYIELLKLDYLKPSQP